MKNRVSLLSAFLCSLLLAACTQSSPRYLIGVSQCSDDDWRTQLNDEILREARFYSGVAVEIRSANDDSDRQRQDICELVDMGVDLLIVSPNVVDDVTPAIEDAYRKGIPVVLVDRRTRSEQCTAYVGADNYDIGRRAGDYIVSRLQGRGRMVEITGLSASMPAIERHRGLVDVLKDAPGIVVEAGVDAGWGEERAGEVFDSLMACHPHIDLVFAHNDRMAAGAYRAALRRGREKEMLFIGVDALSGEGRGVDMVDKGQLDATFIYPTGGDRVMQVAMDILQGRPYEREVLLSTALVNRSNAHVMQMQTSHISVLDGKIETLNQRLDAYLMRYSLQRVVLVTCCIILVLTMALLFFVVRAFWTKKRMNAELSRRKQTLEMQKAKLEQQKAQLEEQKSQLEQQRDQLIELSKQLEEATHAKLVFFTNISHDFRTPLTLIADPVEQLLSAAPPDGQTRQLLLLVRKNVRILLRLVNDILDFRKVENGRMEFRPEPFNLKAGFRGWSDSFRVALRKKHIAFTFEAAPGEDFRLMADGEKMERIYFNLLSNAVKYTPENGKIAVRLAVAGDCYRLTVFNSGSFIPPSEEEAIFGRFYQVDSHRGGTGIGLALVRALVEMHGGSISAHSDGKGTTFTVSFPRQRVALPAGTGDVAVPAEGEELAATLLDAELSTGEEAEDADSPIVLVMDDNADIRAYVKSLLAKDYRVLLAADGTSGIRLAMKYVPDVIVSDVMMPGMDGVECCRRLKNELQTSHIPVILLTACSLDEQRIQGYDGGADSYISKPFSAQLLLSRVRNLISGRQKLKQFFGDGQSLEKESLNALDKDFVTRFRALVEERLKDATLNVEDLGREMGMSRVQLYRKLKSLTNYSPNELLRQMRLNKAASLLSSSGMTVAEVAYEVGFSSPSYFTKCYKEQFGEIPTGVLKRKEGK